jgi:hypothetical protein
MDDLFYTCSAIIAFYRQARKTFSDTNTLLIIFSFVLQEDDYEQQITQVLDLAENLSTIDEPHEDNLLTSTLPKASIICRSSSPILNTEVLAHDVGLCRFLLSGIMRTFSFLYCSEGFKQIAEEIA